MIFGTTTFRCDECGNKFIGLAAEWNATTLIAPMRCTNCGSMHTYPVGFWNPSELFGPGIYKKIWDAQDAK